MFLGAPAFAVRQHSIGAARKNAGTRGLISSAESVFTSSQRTRLILNMHEEFQDIVLICATGIDNRGYSGAHVGRALSGVI